MTGWSYRRGLWSLVGLLLAGGLALFSYLEMKAAEQAARRALADELSSRHLLEQIQQLQRQPRFAVQETESPQKVTEHIEQATRDAGIPPTTLVGLQPESPVRIRNSSYRLGPTRMELEAITLPQLIRFLQQLNRADLGLTVRDLRIWQSAPETGPGPERWSAEIVLTQLIFSPKTR